MCHNSNNSFEKKIFSNVVEVYNNVFILHNKLLVMKKTLPGIFFLLFLSFQSFSQLLSWAPDFPLESSDPVTIIVDASKGNQGLLNYTPTSDLYVHTGVITNLITSNTDWRYVKFSQMQTIKIIKRN